MPIWIIQIIVGVFLAVASTLLKQSDQSSDQASSASGISSTYTTGGSNPQSFVVGTLGLKGQLEYENTWGNSGGTPNAYLTQVFSLGDVPATSLFGLFADAVRQTLPGTGHVAQGYPVTGTRGGYLWYEFHDGTQTTADAFLLSTFGSDPDRPWLSDMVGRGVPYLTVTALYDRTIWSSFPDLLFEVQGIKLYDPRQDSTAGGSGSQRRADPTTYAFTSNPAVIIYNILIGIRYAGNWVWGMQDNVDPARLPYAVWSAAMNACDQNVSLEAGGSEKRFRVGREITLDEKPADVITELLVCCNGRISEAAGVYLIVVGAPGSAVGSFADTDVIVTEGATLDPFPNLDEIVNGATATYLERTQAWQPKEAVPYYRSDLETEDDGRRQATSLTLTAVSSGTRAQRILKATVEDGRRFYRHVLVLPPQFGLYTPLDVLAFTSAKNGYSAKTFLVTSTEEGPNCNVVFGLQEIDASDHDWTPATDEQPFTFTPLTPVRPAAQVLTSLGVAPADFVDGTGTARRPGIGVTWPSGQVDVKTVLVEVIEKVSGNHEWSGEIDYARFPTGGTLPHAFLPAVTYQVRADYIPYSSRAHTPSGWLDVTTNSVPIDIVDFGPQITALLHYFDTALPDVQEQLAKISAALDGQDLNQFQTQETIRSEVAAAVGVTNASVTQLFAAAASATAALAESVTDVKAQAGAATAEVGIEQQARVDGDTALASSVATVSVSLATETTNRTNGDATNATNIANEITNRTAAVTTEASARVAGDTAEATARTAAIAAIGSAVASGLIEFDTLTGPGSSATISIKVRAQVGDAAADSGIVISATSTGLGGTTSQILLKANQLFITDGTHTSDAFTFDATTGSLVLKTLLFQNMQSLDGSVVIDGTAGASKFSFTG